MRKRVARIYVTKSQEMKIHSLFDVVIVTHGQTGEIGRMSMTKYL